MLYRVKKDRHVKLMIHQFPVPDTMKGQVIPGLHTQLVIIDRPAHSLSPGRDSLGKGWTLNCPKHSCAKIGQRSKLPLICGMTFYEFMDSLNHPVPSYGERDGGAIKSHFATD